MTLGDRLPLDAVREHFVRPVYNTPVAFFLTHQVNTYATTSAPEEVRGDSGPTLVETSWI
jgi:hypothetical protein